MLVQLGGEDFENLEKVARTIDEILSAEEALESNKESDENVALQIMCCLLT